MSKNFANRIPIGEGRNTNSEIIQWPLNGIIPNDASLPLSGATYRRRTDSNVTIVNAQYSAE